MSLILFSFLFWKNRAKVRLGEVDMACGGAGRQSKNGQRRKVLRLNVGGTRGINILKTLVNVNITIFNIKPRLCIDEYSAFLLASPLLFWKAI
jgi:hypothetical protein